MKIGIYSGHFDPPHLGHAWIIDQMVSMFDEVHIVLGPNHSKTPEFTEETRLELIYLVGSYEWKDKVKVVKLDAPNIIQYSQRIINELYKANSNKANFWNNRPSIFVVRGIRNDIDWRYEQEIYRCMSSKNPSGSIKFMYLMSPPDKKDISSTNVKKACQMKLWDLVLNWCGRELTQTLLQFYEGKNWTKYKELVSIFETTTAGFCPAGDLKVDKQREILMNSSSGHQLDMKDEKSGKDWLVCNPPVADIKDPPIGLGFPENIRPIGWGFSSQDSFPGDNGTSLQQQASGDAELLNINPPRANKSLSGRLPKWTDFEGSLQQIADPDSGPFDPTFDDLNDIIEETVLDKARDYQRRLEASKLINYSEVITREQAESLLDPFPHKVAVSEKYYLKEIPVNDRVGTIGYRHLPRSRSLGPVLIDKNEMPSYYQGFGKVVVIEGKHRWLDAQARGDKTILAWVGEKALEYFNAGSDLQVLGSGLGDLPAGGSSPVVPQQQT